MFKTSIFLPITLAVFCGLSACAHLPTPTERAVHATTLATERNWQMLWMPAQPFGLVMFGPRQWQSDKTLTVYIEGDGFAWASATQPSLDPTPIHPVGLELALRHPTGNVVYLARPCQFSSPLPVQCAATYWTGGRFSPEVIGATSSVLDVLKQRFGATRLQLVGYSGGGAVAALLAARRQDVETLITVAGNLDHQAWTKHHDIDPLFGSLNPADEVARLGLVKQLHFVGDQDSVVPPWLVQAFADQFPIQVRPRLVVVPGYTHQCCWAQRWESQIADALQ